MGKKLGSQCFGHLKSAQNPPRGGLGGAEPPQRVDPLFSWSSAPGPSVSGPVGSTPVKLIVDTRVVAEHHRRGRLLLG